MSAKPNSIVPDWPAPASVVALCTTRAGGCSAPPYDGFNLALHVGDSEAAVARNRQLLTDGLPAGASIAWLDQVHGSRVVEAHGGSGVPEADAVWTRDPGIACAVMTADCLPVLFCDRRGEVVAAAHAGWRGLQGGVLEATVAAMGVDPGNLLAWLGPAIGPRAFEVGPEVRAAFVDAAGEAGQAATAGCFQPSLQVPGHYFADLYALARLRLGAVGVPRVYGGGRCTFSEPARFFSYRRDGRTGRMASLILLAGTAH